MSSLWLLQILALTASSGWALRVVQRCKVDIDVQCPGGKNAVLGVSCSTESCMASGDSSWYTGTVYDTHDCLTDVGLMVKIDYIKGSNIKCSLVPLVSEEKLVETYSAVETCAQNALSGNLNAASTPAPTEAPSTTTPAPSTPTPAPATTTPAHTTTSPAPTTTTPAPTTPPLSCPVGWQIFESSCFHVSKTRGSYGQGYDYCTQAGGNLASIRSQAENEFVATIVTERTWFGLSDGFTEGEFFWADGSLLIYENWNVGEPNNFLGGEDCSEIGPASSYKWNDERCDSYFLFLCRMPAK